MERGGLPWRLPRQATPACSVVRLAYSWPAAWMSSAMAVAGSPMSNAWSALAISEGQFAGERPAMAAACATSRATATIASTRAAVSAREPRSAPMAEQHVGHACAFAAGQPRCDQCVDLTELVGEHLRATGDHEHHAFADGAADLVHDGPVAGLQGE